MRLSKYFCASAFAYLSVINSARANPGDIFIEFLARPLTLERLEIGHVFFCVSLHLNSGIKEECFGFYPKSEIKAFDGPGVVSNEFTKPGMQNITTSVSHKINDTIRRSIYAEIEKWAGSGYKLTINNCMDFASSIATIAGLKIPPRQFSTVPTEFVDGIKKLYWSGSWTSTDSSNRFRLVIDSSNVEWTEINPESRQTIKKNVVLQRSADGYYSVERENSDDVLRALGYDPAIIPAVVAAKPKPSFIELQREGSVLFGDWNGLIVVKDSGGRFNGLRQPGSTPAKRFDFGRS